jgi:putative hemolysin
MTRLVQLVSIAMLGMLGLDTEHVLALANPASVFCARSGGRSEMRQGPRGQYGVCRLPDGRVVDEWRHFRKMHGKGAGRQ